MAKKTFKQIAETYAPRSEDEKRFIDKHPVVKHADRNGNGDDVFKAKKIKIVKRAPEHGHEVGKDHEVYEEAPVAPEDTFLEEETVGYKHYRITAGQKTSNNEIGSPEHLTGHPGKMKSLGVHTKQGDSYGHTSHVIVTNTVTGEQSHHNVYQREWGKDEDRPTVSIRHLKKVHPGHTNVLKHYLSGKTKLTEEAINEVSKDLLKRYIARGDRSYDRLNDQTYNTWKASDDLRGNPAAYKKTTAAAVKLGAKADRRAHSLNKAEARLKEEVVTEDKYTHVCIGSKSGHGEFNKDVFTAADAFRQHMAAHGARPSAEGGSGNSNTATFTNMSAEHKAAAKKFIDQHKGHHAYSIDLKEEAIEEAYPTKIGMIRKAKAAKQARAVANGYANQKSGKWKSESYKTDDGRWASRDVKEDVEQIDEQRGYKAPELEAAGYKFKSHKAAGAGSPASTLYHHPELDKHIEITHERVGMSGAKKRFYFYSGKYGSNSGGMQSMHHNLNDAIRKNNGELKEDVQLDEAPYYSLEASKARMAKEKARAAAKEAVAAAKKKAAEARKNAKADQSHMIARHIETEVGNHYPDTDGYDAIASKLRKMGIGHHDAITHMDKAARKHLGAKSFSHYVDNFHKDAQGAN